MKVEYTRQQGKRLTYTIDADRFGGFRILLGDKVLRVIGAFRVGPRHGTKEQLANGIAAAKATIEQLIGMNEE